MQLQDPIMVHGILSKLVSNWKKTYIPKVSKFYVEKGFVYVKKCVFYRPEHSENGGLLKLYFEGLLECKDEINQWTRAQRVDEEMGPFVEVSSLLPELGLLKCQKWCLYVFSADNSKKLVKLWAEHVSATE